MNVRGTTAYTKECKWFVYLAQRSIQLILLLILSLAVKSFVVAEEVILSGGAGKGPEGAAAAMEVDP